MTTLDVYPMVLCAECVWREARNQSYQAMVAVAWVIRNRVRLPGHDLVRVVSAPWQFSSMTAPGDPNLVKWPQTGDAAFERCCSAVDAVWGGTFADNTKGATFYYSPPITEAPREWGPTVVTTVIDELTFCKPA
jgi:spore germination cell wall hydrolase CwlJ-like protein